jgi:hypothetical protein
MCFENDKDLKKRSGLDLPRFRNLRTGQRTTLIGMVAAELQADTNTMVD